MNNLVTLRSACLLGLLSSFACGESMLPPRPAPAPGVSSAAPASAAPSAIAAPTTTARGVDAALMDRARKPGEEFYEYANGTWLRTTEIPEDRPSTGAFVRMDEEVLRRTRTILEEASRSGAKPGTAAQRMGDTYASFMDEAAIEAKGIAPLKPLFERLSRIKDKNGLAKELGSQLRVDVDALNTAHFHTTNLFGLWVEQDLNEPSRTTVYLLQGGLGMPDRSYYVDSSARMDELRVKYKAYLTELMKLAGIAAAETKAARVFELEKKIATAHASRMDSFDVAKCNNPWPREALGVKAPGLAWDIVLAAASLDKQPELIAWQPQAVAGIAALVASEPLATWKEYLVVRALDRAAPFLPKAYADAHFALYGTALRGTPKPRDRWKRAIDVTNEAVGDAVGKVYIEKHFRPEYKAEVKSMVDLIVAAFGRRIDALVWMSPETRTRAKAKDDAPRSACARDPGWVHRRSAILHQLRTELAIQAERAGDAAATDDRWARARNVSRTDRAQPRRVVRSLRGAACRKAVPRSRRPRAGVVSCSCDGIDPKAR